MPHLGRMPHIANISFYFGGTFFGAIFFQEAL